MFQDLASGSRGEGPLSLHGRVVAIIIPAAVAFEDERDLGRAIFAWRYKLTPEEVFLAEAWCHGNGQLDLMNKNPYYRIRKSILEKLGVRSTEQFVVIAARHGLNGGADA